MKPVVGPVSIGDSEIQNNKNQYTLKYNNEIKTSINLVLFILFFEFNLLSIQTCWSAIRSATTRRRAIAKLIFVIDIQIRRGEIQHIPMGQTDIAHSPAAR